MSIFIEVVPMSVSEEQRANFMKLAKYLWHLPEDYTKFNMRYFVSTDGHVMPSPAELLAERNICGTAACAVGHAPMAGIGMEQLHNKYRTNWMSYTTHNFCFPFSNEFSWCFGCTWAKIDNTPHGAAKRIFYMLRTGQVPKMPDDPLSRALYLLAIYKNEEYPNE